MVKLCPNPQQSDPPVDPLAQRYPLGPRRETALWWLRPKVRPMSPPLATQERLRAEQRASLPVGVGMGAALGVILSFLGEGEGGSGPQSSQRVHLWTRVAHAAGRDSSAVAEGAGL